VTLCVTDVVLDGTTVALRAVDGVIAAHEDEAREAGVRTPVREGT